MNENAVESGNPSLQEAAKTHDRVVSGVGVVEDIGLRKKMQDAHVSLESFGGRKDRSFFAVYDGHGGREAADIAASALHEVFLKELDRAGSAEEAMERAFLETDREIEAAVKSAGTTAAVAYLEGKHLVVGNVGDTRVVLDRDGKAQRLTKDHRIGIATLTRALGDAYVGEYVSPNPDIAKIELQRGDRRLILACDGVWNRMSDQEAVEMIKRFKYPNIASEFLMQEALKRRSTDNITVMVVDFKQSAL